MRDLIQAVVLEGQQVRVTARDPLPIEAKALAVAAAIRVFDRYPVVDRLLLTVGEDEVRLSREEVERLVGPEGFARLKDREGAREVLTRAIQAYAAEGTP
ncbi:MAG TPA: hypothetical protein VGW35_23220 [Methylomirabilota bacterium]|jgi:hypothetical protein|nr:hypothetical protein [Methylomirabilota bacterium]